MIKKRTLIIPDLHHKVLWIDNFLKNQTHNEVVFLGDYFDAFGDTVTDAQKTAHWLKYALEEYPNAHFLMGNHDAGYRFPANIHLSCAGFTRAKSDAINSILTQDDWAKLKLYHFTQEFLCTHAGLTKWLYQIDPAIEDLDHLCEVALRCASSRLPDKLLGAGYDRGGTQPVGGLIWCDWYNFRPLDGINQIMGHSSANEVRARIITDKTTNQDTSINYCIDTHASHVGVIEDGKFSWMASTCPQKGKSSV